MYVCNILYFSHILIYDIYYIKDNLYSLEYKLLIIKSFL